jgi:hypothetical protein
MQKRTRALMSFGPVLVAAAWVVLAKDAQGDPTTCSDWSDLISTIESTVSDPMAREAMIDRAEALRDASNCDLYTIEQYNFGAAFTYWSAAGLLPEEEADSVASCWEQSTNAMGTCNVIAGQEDHSARECDFQAIDCSTSNDSCDCKETYVKGQGGQKRVTGCRNGKREGHQGPCVPTL